jgi:hypothetical protein
MNAILPVEAASGGDAWERAVRSANAWRGQALQCFAQAETAVSESLLVLAADPERGEQVRLRRPIGQRFEDLASAVGAGGPFAAEGSRASQALSAFRQNEALRSFLCHGIVKVAIDRNEEWVVLIKTLSFLGRKPERSTLALDEREAKALLAKMKALGRSLASALQSLRARIGD